MFFEIDQDILKSTDQSLIKRWFRDSESDCDLMVWEDAEQNIERFQFWSVDALLEWNKSGGIKTGHVDKSNGVFTHYQSELYRLHNDLNTQIVEFVINLVKNRKSEQHVLNKIYLILSEISKKKLKKRK